MTTNKNAKLAVREYAQSHHVPYAQARRMMAEQPTPARVPTQMTRLDEILGGGLPRGEVTALWAATGVGTSMFGITLARMTAMSANHAIIVAAESGRELYLRRLIAATTGITTGALSEQNMPSDWPPAWGEYLHIFEPDRLPTDPVETANELRADAHNAGHPPTLIIVDDLRSFQMCNPDAPLVFAELARDLRAAVVVIDALPSVLCRVPPTHPAEFDDITTLGWPERVPSDEELRADEQTQVLAATATTSLILTTPGDPPVEGDVTVLDLTVRTGPGPSGGMKVRRVGSVARILPGG